jgi:predicted alpha/beta superfamily hydrolase
MDYTPTREERLQGSGDAAKFLEFLKKDAIPFVEKNYNADPSKRVLMGSSLGGLFTLYTMFTEPNLFYGYVAASPAVSYGDNFSFKQEKQFAENHKDLSARLFIAVGDIEDLTQPVEDFMQTVKSRSYKGLKLETRILEGERHAGNKPEAYNRGLRFVFSDE